MIAIKRLRWAVLAAAMAGTAQAASLTNASRDGGPESVQASSQTADALTLDQCWQLARAQAETLKIQQQQQAIVAAQYKQARGAVLPDFHFLMSETIQDTTGVNATGSNAALVKGDIHQSRFQVQQPLFRGLKEFATMSGLKAEGRREAFNLRRDETVLFEQVAQAFYNVVQAETEYADVQDSINLTSDRLKELNARVRLGKSRNSEVLSAESELASLRAQLVHQRGQITASRDTLSFYIGRDARPIPLRDDIPPVPAVEGLDDALKRAADRSDVAALREDMEAKAAGIRVAKADYWPFLNFTGDYYTRRPGIQNNINWDLVFALDVPIYQGGTVKGLTQQAIAEYEQSQLSYQQLERSAATDVKRAHALLTSSIDESRALEDAYNKARRSYEAQVREYRLGLVNNLDVLAALTALQTAKQEYDVSLLTNKFNWITLRLATDNF